MNNEFITFVNHASIIISHENIRLITDPWLFGSAFNNGWTLLSESKFRTQDFQNITHIWFSHEHPDHFHPFVLKSIPENFRKNKKFVYACIITKLYNSKISSFGGFFFLKGHNGTS